MGSDTVSKIIRTVRLGGEVVTLGAAERNLHEELEEQSLESIGLEKIIEEQLAELHKHIDGEWENKLRQEMEYLQSQADKRLQEVETRGDEERNQIHQQRYDEGYQVGLDEREAESVDAVSRMGVLHDNLIAERTQVLKEAEETVIDLASALAKRIVGFQAEASPKVLVQVVRAALRHLSDRSNLEIMVHPDDLQIARRFAAHWVETVEQDSVLKVRASDHVGRGGCMIEGREENVDARLEEQANVLHDGLRAAFSATVEQQAEEAKEPIVDRPQATSSGPSTGVVEVDLTETEDEESAADAAESMEDE
jgi:flagellar assembly protein FliH